MWNTSSCILSPANHVKYHKLFCQCLGSVIIHCSPLILLRFDFMPRLAATEKGNYCSSSSSCSAQKHLEWDQLSTGATPSQFSCWGAVLGTASAEDRVLIKLPQRAQWWPPPVGWDKQRPAQAHLHTHSCCFVHLRANQDRARPVPPPQLPVNTRLAFSSSSWGTLKLKDSL